MINQLKLSIGIYRVNTVLRQNHIDMINTDIGNEIKLRNEKIKNDFLKRSISILASEIDDVRNILLNEIQDIEIPSRPFSVHSNASNVSNNEDSKEYEA